MHCFIIKLAEHHPPKKKKLAKHDLLNGTHTLTIYVQPPCGYRRPLSASKLTTQFS